MKNHKSAVEDVETRDFPLLRPRKQPQQQRSRMMVKAITDACRKILDEQGVEFLTISDLEAVSGVGKGSIYQYFPSLDSVIAQVYSEALKEHYICRHETLFRSWAQAEASEILWLLVDSVISCHRHFLTLHSTFYKKHLHHFDVTEHYDEIFSLGASVDLIRQLITEKICKDTPAADNLISVQIHVFIQAFRLTCRNTLQERPEYFDTDEFSQTLYNMGAGILSVKNTNPL